VIDAATLAQAKTLLAAYGARGWRIATAESCTGGLIAATLTAIPGSSDVVDRGFISYSNAAKTAMLGIPEAVIAAQGAVSEAVAQLMAAGALAHSDADVAVAVTGIAGPGGGTPEKPVGLVWFGLARRAGPGATLRCVFPGDRSDIREAAVRQAFDLLRPPGAGEDRFGG
jgi:nicotinamide-nucleotide amidase